jgi:hypothetical protein
LEIYKKTKINFQLDHQLEVYASPAIDLIYSLYFDLSHDNRVKYRDDYIMYYHNEFVKALKSYGYSRKPPSLLDLQVEILKNGALEVLMTIVFCQYSFIDWSAITPEDFDMGEGSERFKKRCAANPAFKKVMEHELPRIFYKGII